MCVTCGCGGANGATLTLHDVVHEHVHADGTRHTHGHAQVPAFAAAPFRQQALAHAHTPAVPDIALSVPGRDAHTIQLETRILGKNQGIADRNRRWLEEHHILALNLVSSPGAGKTTLLERTLSDLKSELAICVVEGDQETSNDAERIRATGIKSVQVNTGTGCHLEADMLERAIAAVAPMADSLMMIENVGNLVCPALFDLGERAKIVIFSVTEGEDKPLKYPHMFRAAGVLLLSKVDLLPHVRFDIERAAQNALAVNPELTVFRVSAYTGEGMLAWYAWLKQQLAEVGAVKVGIDGMLQGQPSAKGPACRSNNVPSPSSLSTSVTDESLTRGRSGF